MITEGFRPFIRSQDRIHLKLRMGDWPSDVPLPPQTDVVGVGENHEIKLSPHWNLLLKPDCTVEYFGGWFRFPLKLNESRQWYVETLSKLGWMLKEEFVHEPKLSLEFKHATNQIDLSVRLQWYESLNETHALITRITTHPWQPIVIDLDDDGVSEDQMPLPLVEEMVK